VRLGSFEKYLHGGLFVLAFILVKIEAGKDEEVYKRVNKLAEIKKANATYGIFDLHIEVEFETPGELDAFVFNKLRKIPGVKETATMITSKILK